MKIYLRQMSIKALFPDSSNKRIIFFKFNYMVLEGRRVATPLRNVVQATHAGYSSIHNSVWKICINFVSNYSSSGIAFQTVLDPFWASFASLEPVLWRNVSRYMCPSLNAVLGRLSSTFSCLGGVFGEEYTITSIIFSYSLLPVRHPSSITLWFLKLFLRTVHALKP